MSAPGWTVRVAVTPEGEIEAALGLGVHTRSLAMDRRTGAVIRTSPGVRWTPVTFRLLVRAAREHVAQ